MCVVGLGQRYTRQSHIANILWRPSATLVRRGRRQDLIDKGRLKGKTEEQYMIYFLQLIDAMRYMHRMGILHRDLKVGCESCCD